MNNRAHESKITLHAYTYTSMLHKKNDGQENLLALLVLTAVLVAVSS